MWPSVVRPALWRTYSYVPHPDSSGCLAVPGGAPAADPAAGIPSSNVARAAVVAMLDVALHQTPCISQRQGRSRRDALSLERFAPSFDLSVRLRLVGRSPDMGHARYTVPAIRFHSRCTPNRVRLRFAETAFTCFAARRSASPSCRRMKALSSRFSAAGSPAAEETRLSGEPVITRVDSSQREVLPALSGRQYICLDREFGR